MGSLSRLKGETRSQLRCSLAWSGAMHLKTITIFIAGASEASGLLIMIRNKAARLGTEKGSERSERHGFPHPLWGLTTARKFRIGQTKLCHFFREVKQDKRIAIRTTKVSYNRILTFFWLIVISTPYQFSLTVVTVHNLY